MTSDDLWFLSIQMQWYLLVPLLVLLLARRRRLFRRTRGVHRPDVGDLPAHDGAGHHVVRPSLSTFARADALLLGVLLAVTLRGCVGSAGTPRPSGPSGASAWSAWCWSSREGSPLAFLEGWGVAFTVTALVVVACVMLHERPSLLTRLLSRPSLVWLGQASLVIYVWRSPAGLLGPSAHADLVLGPPRRSCSCDAFRSRRGVGSLGRAARADLAAHPPQAAARFRRRPERRAREVPA